MPRGRPKKIIQEEMSNDEPIEMPKIVKTPKPQSKKLKPKKNTDVTVFLDDPNKIIVTIEFQT